MKNRRDAEYVTPEERKIPITVALNSRYIKLLDRLWRRRGSRNRSEYLRSLIDRDAKR